MLQSWGSVRLSSWIAVSICLLLVGCGSQEPPAAQDTAASAPQTAPISPPEPQPAPAPPPAPAPAPLPSPSTANVTLSWTAPTENTDGSVLTNLTGFKIYYGMGATQLTNTITLTNPGLATYVIDNLSVGQTYYFAVSAVTTGGTESAMSPPVSRTIT